MRGFRFRFAVVATLSLAGCAPSDEVENGEASTDVRLPLVMAVNEPLRALAARLGGDRFDVRFPGPPDEDPAFWKPDAETLQSIQTADLILLNGAGFARWTTQASLPFSRCVDTSVAFADRLIVADASVTHSHGPDGDHSHGETAFTTWIDPSLLLEHARAVRTALVTLDPSTKAEIDARFAALETEIGALDAAALAIDSSRRGEPMLASHPVYQYLARRLDLDLRSVHFEPDVVPDDAGWAELDARLAERPVSPVKWMLWEGAPDPRTVAGLEARGVGVIVFDPCGAAVPADGYLAAQRANFARLVAAWSSSR